MLNHDRFTPAERGAVGATPEALGAIFPFGCRLPKEVEEKTVRFYLDPVDPYLGSPMLSSVLGVFAARLGERERATRLFEAGYLEYLNEPWRDCNEFSRTRFPDKPVVGPFYANLGGFLTALLYGLTGLQPGPAPPSSGSNGRRPCRTPGRAWRSSGSSFAAPPGGSSSGKATSTPASKTSGKASRAPDQLKTRTQPGPETGSARP